MDGVHAGGFEPARDLDRILQPVAAFPIERERAGVVVVLRVEFDSEKEIAPDLRAHGGDHFEEKARPVFERAAVIVRPVIDGRAEKLGDDVAVGALQLDAIRAGLSRTRAAAAANSSTTWLMSLLRHRAHRNAGKTVAFAGGTDRDVRRFSTPRMSA